MTFEMWVAFVVAFTAISLIPGPSVLMVVGRALAYGRRAALICVLGDAVGGIFLIALSLFGVGAILAASPMAFLAVKWAGVIYMAYLGVCQIKEARSGNMGDMAGDIETEVARQVAQNQSGRTNLRIGFLSGILNPKAIMFYAAFLAQFLDPGSNIVAQFAILVVTSCIIIGAVLGGYVLAATRARQLFQSPLARRRVGYAGGGFMLGGSAIMAVAR